MYVKTLDAVYRHPYFCPPFVNVCRIRIYETPPNDDRLPTVFVASQLPESMQGTSITNAAEELATEVVRSQRSRRLLCPDDARYGAVWVQHYPPGVVVPADLEERFSVVSFTELPDGSLVRPSWKPAARSWLENTILQAGLDD